MGSGKNGRSTLEKVLLGVLFLNMAAVIILAVFVATKDDVNVVCTFAAGGSSSLLQGGPATTTTCTPTVEDVELREVCTSQECVTAASNLIESMDDTVSPCENFYQFACGKWNAMHKIPESESRYSTFTQMGDKIDITLKSLLEAPSPPKEQDYITKAKNLYASCIDFEHINNQSSQPVKDLINELGGWPLVSTGWNDTGFSLTQLLLKVNKYNLLPLIFLYASTDIMEPNKTNLHMDQTDFGLPGMKYYNASNPDNKKYITAYTDFMFGVANLIGLATNTTTAKKQVQDVLVFETALSKITATDEERRDPYKMNNPQKLKYINGNYSIPELLNMTEYVLGMMSMPGIDVHNITEEEIIINESPNFFKEMTQLLNKTETQTIANYVVWRSVQDNIGMLSKEFRDLYTEYRRVVFGLKSDYPRDGLCLNYVNREMGFAAGRLFLDALFSAEAKETADDMIDHLQSSFNAHLKDLDWMDNTTRNLAQDKNEHITRRIGYPDSNKNDTYLTEFYASTVINKDTFYRNVLNTKHRSFVDDASTFRKPTDKTRWTDPPQTVNAYYSPDKNQITFPAGILQPPFFHSNFPKYLNYGGMGMVIGHEITHGFDDEGRQFDKDGKLKNWWTNATSVKYNEKAKCIIDQYTGFSKNIEGKDYHVNGVTTQGENIADNGGIKMSYHAYKTWASKLTKPEPSLPGLNYTNDQLFFINFAQSWCGLARDEHVIELILTDPHPPGFFRVRGIAENMPDFGPVFNCASDAKMNPTNKCSVW